MYRNCVEADIGSGPMEFSVTASSVSERPIRIAYVVTHPIQYQAPLLRRLAACRGLSLHVYFLSDFSLYPHFEVAFNQQFCWDIPLTDGYQSEVVSRWWIGPSRDLLPAWPVAGFKNLLRSQPFDAVWVHGWGHIGLRQAIAAAHRLGIPVLLRGESTLHAASGCIWRRRVRNALCRRLFRQVSGFLCIGSMNREFYKNFGIRDERLFCVPYAVDNEWFQARCREAAPTREERRAQLDLFPGRSIILFAGKLTPVKAPGDLLEAYLAAFSADCPLRPYLLFAGDGPLRRELQQRASARVGDVRFLGFQNQTQLPALYDLCDVFVLPSRFEPWGLVVNEVMNAGRPVIVSDKVGAAPDLVVEGSNGWTFPVGDISALAAALRQACVDVPDRREIGLQSVARINQWDFDADQRGILAALRAVLGKGGRGL